MHATVDPSAECTIIQAPLNWATQTGVVDLAVGRLPATDPANRIGVLAVNPGGPGASGIDFLLRAPIFRSGLLRERFDIVAWDPRGTGRSTSMDCLDPADNDESLYGPVAAPSDPARWDQALTNQRAHFAACRSNTHPGLLDNISTADTARDLNLIRQHLEEPQISYLGFSYGTFLGATWLALFGDTARAAVLDGGIDPGLWQAPTIDAFAAQVEGFTDMMTRWANDPATTARFPDHPTPIEAILDLVDRAHSQPIPSRFDRDATPATITYATLAALYSTASWPLLTTAVESALNGDSTGLWLLADAYTGRNPDGTYQPILDASTATSCADKGTPLPVEQAIASAEAAAATTPDPLNMLSYAIGCTGWDVDTSSRYPGPYSAPNSPPVVVIGTTSDPATPYLWSQRLAATLDHGILLTRTGEGHTAYGKDRCVTEQVDAYLVSLIEPSRLTC